MYRNYDYRYSIYFIVVMALIAIYYIAIKTIDIFYVVSSSGDFDTYYPMLCSYALFLCLVPMLCSYALFLIITTTADYISWHHFTTTGSVYGALVVLSHT